MSIFYLSIYLSAYIYIYLSIEVYLRRFKKEKRLRRKVQDRLELESIKKAKLEEALSSISYQTFLQLKEES